MIVRYKMIMTDGGAKAPSYITDGGYWGDSNGLFIGFVKDIQSIDVPALDIIGVNELFLIIKSMNPMANVNVKDNKNSSPVPMTDKEIMDEIHSFISRNTDLNTFLVKDAKERSGRLLKQLNKICDEKSVNEKTFINGSEVSQELLERYQNKYDIAKRFKATGTGASLLVLESDLTGLTTTQLADLIIAKGDAYKKSLSAFHAKIESVRVKVKAMITAGQLDAAQVVIKKIKTLSRSATNQDIKNLFI